MGSIYAWVYWIFDGDNGYYAMDASNRNIVYNNLSQKNFTEIIKLSDIQY